jgi:hypothetical protein
LSGNALHEYSGRCAPPVELVSDEDVGLGPADELLGQVLVRGDLLLAEVVDEGLPPAHVDHYDLLASRGMHWVSGRWRQLRDGWCVKLVDEDTRWYLSASRTKLRQDVRCNVVVADDVVELETIVLTQNLHLAPSTQQAEQAGFTREEITRRASQFSLKINKRQSS